MSKFSFYVPHFIIIIVNSGPILYNNDRLYSDTSFHIRRDSNDDTYRI